MWILQLSINKLNEEIRKAKPELYGKFDRNKSEEIISTLEKHNELSRKYLQQRKIKKLNYVKFKAKNQSQNEEIIHTDKRTNECYKLSYAAVLKRKRNTNLQRKFSKQNLPENEPNNSIKNLTHFVAVVQIEAHLLRYCSKSN